MLVHKANVGPTVNLYLDNLPPKDPTNPSDSTTHHFMTLNYPQIVLTNNSNPIQKSLTKMENYASSQKTRFQQNYHLSTDGTRSY